MWKKVIAEEDQKLEEMSTHHDNPTEPILAIHEEEEDPGIKGAEPVEGQEQEVETEEELLSPE